RHPVPVINSRKIRRHSGSGTNRLVTFAISRFKYDVSAHVGFPDHIRRHRVMRARHFMRDKHRAAATGDIYPALTGTKLSAAVPRPRGHPRVLSVNVKHHSERASIPLIVSDEGIHRVKLFPVGRVGWNSANRRIGYRSAENTVIPVTSSKVSTCHVIFPEIKYFVRIPVSKTCL